MSESRFRRIAFDLMDMVLERFKAECHGSAWQEAARLWRAEPTLEHIVTLHPLVEPHLTHRDGFCFAASQWLARRDATYWAVVSHHDECDGDGVSATTRDELRRARAEAIHLCTNKGGTTVDPTDRDAYQAKFDGERWIPIERST